MRTSIGHIKEEKTYLLQRRPFHWPKLRHAVDILVQRCTTCPKPQGNLNCHILNNMLPIPIEFMTCRFLHLIMELSSTKIMSIPVGVRLKLKSIFLYDNGYNVSHAANLNFREAMRPREVPQVFISGCDVKIMCQGWKTLWLMFGTQLSLSLNCRQRYDGEMELVKSLLSLLPWIIIKKWEDCLPHIEIAHYMVVLSRTQMCSPFDVVYRSEPITILDWMPLLQPREQVNMKTSNKAENVKKIHIKRKLEIVKESRSYALRANKNFQNVVFDPGDSHWLHLWLGIIHKLLHQGRWSFKVLA